MSKKISQSEIHNEDGDMIRIEFYDTNGEHIVDALWDENDAQTPENRIEFRKWAYHMMRQKGYKID